jgi:predicted transposase YbfD/YdcC
MGCQFLIGEDIVQSQADYVFALKGNQGEFHDDIKLFMDTNLKQEFANIAHTHFNSVNGDH